MLGQRGIKKISQRLIKRITHNAISRFSLFSSGGCGIVMAHSYVYRLSGVEGCLWTSLSVEW